MKYIQSTLLTSSLLAALTLPAYSAENEQNFAIRFGGVLADPTSNSTILGENSEFDSAAGAELDFEWYFKPNWGLDLSSVGATDVRYENHGRDVGISMSTFTVGVNYHPVRTPNLDWSIGLLLGRVSYGDFVIDDNTVFASVEDDMAYGFQTSVDISPKSWEHWAFNLGVKYLNSSAEFAGTVGEVNVDPLIWRAMIVYRW